MGNKLNLIGQKFSRLTVVGELSTRTSMGLVEWKCVCDCGAACVVAGANLKKGCTRSCGCLQREKARSTGVAAATHRMSDRLIYGVWRGMHKRCYTPKTPNFHNYGGRGITVCSRWHSFEAFYQDMGDAPAGMSIERVNVNGNYEPENCCWATSKQQANNKRANIHVEHEGQRKTIAEWSDTTGVSRHTMYWRSRQGWSAQRILASL